MRILVTGGAGFGGSSLVHALLLEGHEVTALDVIAPNNVRNLSDFERFRGFSYYWKSVHDLLPDDVKAYQIIVHLAAQADSPLGFSSPRWTISQNVDGTVNLLECVRIASAAKLFLYAGSGSETGLAVQLPITESHPLTPRNPYAFSKAAAEMAVWTWYRAYGVPATVLSSGVVVGPDMRREVFIFKWLWNAYRGLPIIVEGGDQTRDITYVDDVVHAWRRAIEVKPSIVVGNKYLITYGKELALRELAELCLKVSEKQVPIVFRPYRLGEFGLRQFFDTSQARLNLGYVPAVGPEEAIRRTWEWVRQLSMDPWENRQ